MFISIENLQKMSFSSIESQATQHFRKDLGSQMVHLSSSVDIMMRFEPLLEINSPSRRHDRMWNCRRFVTSCGETQGNSTFCGVVLTCTRCSKSYPPTLLFSQSGLSCVLYCSWRKDGGYY
jgi:hypothetical protein